MRTIAISDIHGHYDEFVKLLDAVRYVPNQDRLYLLGDYVDKGLQSKEVVQFIMQLSAHKGVKIIGGNHDDMFVRWADNNELSKFPYANSVNSGINTITSFAPFYKKGFNDVQARKYVNLNYRKEIEFLRSLPYYIEDEKHIFVHAGIDPKQKDWKETSPKDFRWIREKFHEADISYIGKTIVFGHTVTNALRDDPFDFSVWFSEGKIGIDGGSKVNGQLNALIIEGDTYQCVSVPSVTC